MHKYLLIFALLIGGAACGQWSSNPHDHVLYSCGIYAVTMGQKSLCSDGAGGVFMTTGFSTGGWADERRLWLFHVNADGYSTLQGDECPQMIRVDSAQYSGGPRDGQARLIPSEPSGTVIVLMTRYLLDDQFHPTYLGMVIAKFDTLGLTGFGRLFIPADTTFQFVPRGYDGLWDFQGWEQGMSDGHGGVHLVFRGVPFGNYYNHISMDGTFRYTLPGVYMRGTYLYADGVGGALDMWIDGSQMYAQRYNAFGDSVFEQGGRLVPVISYGSTLITLAPNRMLYRMIRNTGGFNQQYLFLLDSNLVNLWEPQGRLFRSDTLFMGAIIPDKTGGFFFYEYANGDTMIATLRYGPEAELLASSVRSRHALWQADGLGGGYLYVMQGQVWRWQADMTPAWPDSLIVFDNGGSVLYTAVEGGGLVGPVSTSNGFGFYHVNPDGRLGPRTDADFPQPKLPNDFRIVSVYPNPFNGSVHIQFSSDASKLVRLMIYDVLGRQVYSGEPQRISPGLIDWSWAPNSIASGRFFVQIRAVNRGHDTVSPMIPITYVK